MLKQGLFISYQMAEAIELLEKYDIFDSYQKEQAEINLEKLKEKWINKDTVVGYAVKMPELAGMQDITVDEVFEISKKSKNVDEYSTECMANMNYCLVKDTDGNVGFDFSHFRKIANLARKNGKKIIIDSAIAFGDRFPENIANMSKEEVEFTISQYIKQLTGEFGDCIERIDVLNSIFERNDVKNKEGTITSEDYWKNLFGENYGKEVLDIVKDNIKGLDIKLGWNEFYLTSNTEKRRNFLQRISNIENLDTIGIQDAFRVDNSPEKMIESLKEISDFCESKDKNMSITELSAKVGRKDIEYLNEARKNGKYDVAKSELEERAKNIMNTVIDFSSNNVIVESVHSRYSDKYDCNHIECKKYGHDISTNPNSNTNIGFEKKDEFYSDNNFISSLKQNVYSNNEVIINNIKSNERESRNEPSRSIQSFGEKVR